MVCRGRGVRRRGGKDIPCGVFEIQINGLHLLQGLPKIGRYECVINDEATPVVAGMARADIIVIATPLYFFSQSAQSKALTDRMFSLYKWNNETGTFTTPLKGKTLVLMASAYEDVGLDALARPFKLTADYTGMKFFSLLVPNAGVSGDIKKNAAVKKKTIEFSKKIAAATRGTLCR